MRAVLLLLFFVWKVHTSYQTNPDIAINGVIKETKDSKSYILYFIVNEKIFEGVNDNSKCKIFFYLKNDILLADNQSFTKKNAKQIFREGRNYYMCVCKISKLDILSFENTKLQQIRVILYGFVKKFSLKIILHQPAVSSNVFSFLKIRNFVFSTKLNIIDVFYVSSINYGEFKCFNENQKRIDKSEVDFEIEFFREKIVDFNEIESIFLIDNSLGIFEIRWQLDRVLIEKSGIVYSTESALACISNAVEKTNTLTCEDLQDDPKNHEVPNKFTDSELLTQSRVSENYETKNENTDNSTDNDKNKNQSGGLGNHESHKNRGFSGKTITRSAYFCIVAMVFLHIFGLYFHFYNNTA